MKTLLLAATVTLTLSATAFAEVSLQSGEYVGSDLEGSECSLTIESGDGYWFASSYTDRSYPAYRVEQNIGLRYEAQYDVSVDPLENRIVVVADIYGNPIDFSWFQGEVKRNRCFFSQ